MKEFTVTLVGTKTCTADVIIQADSSDEAIDIALEMANQNQLIWDVEEKITNVEVDYIDHDDWDDDEDEEDEPEVN